MQPDLIWTVAGFILTLLIFCYLLGDNLLFRIAVYLFVGVAAGYIFVIAIYQALLPRLIWPLVTGSWLERGLTVVPLVLGLLLFTRLVPRFARLGNIPLAYLVGAGAAVTVGGAVLGTLFGQVSGTINQFDLTGKSSPLAVLVSAIVVLVGTASTLVYFQFGAVSHSNQPPQRSALVESVAKIGQVFIAVTLGALFAGVYAAALSALIDRLDFIKTFVLNLIG